MNLHKNGVCLLSAVSIGLVCCATASANDLPSGRAAPGLDRAATRCEAEYGPGFMPAGDGACVWVGGHVRVGYGPRGGEAPDNGWASGSGASARSGAIRVNAGDAVPLSGSMTGRLRLNDGAASIAR